MGSFGMTCGVSGIHVDWATSKVKLLFLVETPFYDDANPIYIYSKHQFCSYAMDATYEDYGNYEFDLECDQFKGFVDMLKKHGAKIEEGENSCHDVPFDPENPEHLKWEYLENAIQEGRVYIKGIDRKNHQVSMFPIYIDVWNDICMTPKCFGWDNTKYTVESIAKSFKEGDMDEESIKIHKELIAMLEAKTELTPIEEFSLENAREKFKPYRTIERRMGFEEFCTHYRHDFHDESMGEDWVCDRVAEVRMVDGLMATLHKPLAPVMYGGQDNLFEEFVDFHVSCAKIGQRLIDEDEDLGVDY